VLAVILLSFSPLIFSHSRTAMLDLPLTAMVSLSFFSLLKTKNFSSLSFSLFTGILFSLAQFTKETAIGQVQFLLEKDFFCKISLPVLTNFF